MGGPKREMSNRTVAALLAVLLCAPHGAAAAEGVFAGIVRDGGAAPVAGAMVSAIHERLQRSTTVFTDDAGRFRLPPLEVGAYDLRVRRIGYRRSRPASRCRSAKGPAGSSSISCARPIRRRSPGSCRRAAGCRCCSAQLSSDAHREEFMRQCTFCHQQGSWATRVPRSRADWEKIFKLMGRMGGVISTGTARRAARRLQRRVRRRNRTCAALTARASRHRRRPDAAARQR